MIWVLATVLNLVCENNMVAKKRDVGGFYVHDGKEIECEMYSF